MSLPLPCCKDTSAESPPTGKSTHAEWFDARFPEDGWGSDDLRLNTSFHAQEQEEEASTMPRNS